MNIDVDEAMKIAAIYNGGDDEMHRAGQVLAKEVERLRGEVADTKSDRDSWRRVCEKETEEKHQAWGELAAAKAASVVPVRVLNIFEGTYESDRYIELRTDAEADTFRNWLRERMKDNTPPAA